jgi:hypothetical protein
MCSDDQRYVGEVGAQRVDLAPELDHFGSDLGHVCFRCALGNLLSHLIEARVDPIEAVIIPFKRSSKRLKRVHTKAVSPAIRKPLTAVISKVSGCIAPSYAGGMLLLRPPPPEFGRDRGDEIN